MAESPRSQVSLYDYLPSVSGGLFSSSLAKKPLPTHTRTHIHPTTRQPVMKKAKCPHLTAPTGKNDNSDT